MRAFFLLSLCICLLSCERDIPAGFCEASELTIDASRAHRNVLIVGIDGFRSDVLSQKASPFMFNFSSRSDVYFTAAHQTEEDTYSGPNWSSILTGVHYNKHNVTDNSFKGRRFDIYPPFQYFLNTAYNHLNSASISNWTPINKYVCQDFFDYSNKSSINDSLVYIKAKEFLLDSMPFLPNILFLQFDELDVAGHQYGFSSEVFQYTNTLKAIDYYTQELFEIIEEKRQNSLEDWLFIIVSDHGGEDHSHGDANNPNINQTIFFSQHPKLIFNQSHNTNMTDLAPTILDYMGVSSEELDCKLDGISLLEN